jgi:membrane fusion protein, multidrug efflux system
VGRIEQATMNRLHALRRAVVNALLVLPLALLGCRQPPKTAVPIRPVRTVTVEPRDVGTTLSQTGDIEARTETDFGFRVGGKIVARPVDVGSRVRTGEVLARLDDQPERNRLQSAQAALAAAQAELVRTQAEEGRQSALLKDGYTTKQRYDTALRDLQTAEAQLASARAQLNLAQDTLAYTQLHAGMNGVVTEVFADAGQVVAAGQKIVRVADPKALEGVFGVPAIAFSMVPRDAKVQVALTDDPHIETTGTIRYASPQADPLTRTYTVRVALADAPPEMRMGATVTGRVTLPGQKVIELPGAALFEQDGKPAVWVFDPASGTVLLKPVRVLRYESGVVLIASGLARGDIVVTAGVHVLRPGEKVRRLAEASQ